MNFAVSQVAEGGFALFSNYTDLAAWILNGKPSTPKILLTHVFVSVMYASTTHRTCRDMVPSENCVCFYAIIDCICLLAYIYHVILPIYI